MKTKTKTFEALSDLNLFPPELTGIIDGYVSRYDVQLAKKLYAEASAGYGPEGCYKHDVFGWFDFGRQTLTFLFRIFALALHALSAEKDFDCKFFKETYGQDWNSYGDLSPDALEMLEIILVGFFAPQASYRNLINFINYDEDPKRNKSKWKKFKYIAWSSLSLILTVVSINSKFIQLISNENFKKGYKPFDRNFRNISDSLGLFIPLRFNEHLKRSYNHNPFDSNFNDPLIQGVINELLNEGYNFSNTNSNISDTVDYFLDSKISYSRTRYVSFFNDNHGKHYLFALTDHESEKMKKICDSYCDKEVSTLKLGITGTLKKLPDVDVPGFKKALNELIQSVEDCDSADKIIALLVSSLNKPELQRQSFLTALKNIDKFFPGLPSIEQCRFSISTRNAISCHRV